MDTISSTHKNTTNHSWVENIISSPAPVTKTPLKPNSLLLGRGNLTQAAEEPVQKNEHEPIAEREVGHTEDLPVRHLHGVSRKVEVRASAAIKRGLLREGT